MKTLVIGSTGYTGSRIAREFQLKGENIYGLARTQQGEDALSAAGITPFPGNLMAVEQWKEQLEDFGTVIFCASIPFEQEQQVLGSLLGTFAKAGRTLIFISGSGVVSTPAVGGEWHDYTAAEDDPYPFASVLRNRQVRLATERLVLDATRNGFRGIVIRPPLVWGHGGSIQVPQFFESARKTGYVCYLGQGLNLYSHVHVDDVATATYLAFEKGTAGSV